MAATQLLTGERTPEQQLAILRAAEGEAVRYGLRQTPFAAPLAAVAGASWVNIGPSTADYEFNGGLYSKVDSGRARRILVDPRDANIVYLATSGGGVWKTYDALAAQAHWHPITESIGSLSIGTIAMNPADPDSLVLGLGDPFDVRVPGLLHSDDAGATWSTAVTLVGSYAPGVFYTATSVRELGFDPLGALVFAATDVGLFRSQEAGVTANWTLMQVDGATPQECWSVVNAGPDTFLASCIDANTRLGAIWRTTDQGATWVKISLGSADTDVGRLTLAAARIPGTQVWQAYALASNGAQTDQKDVFLSTDGGASFTSLAMIPGGRGPANAAVDGSGGVDQNDLDFTHDQAFYNQMIVVDPQNPSTVFIGGNLCMGRSTDSGQTWTLLTVRLPEYSVNGTVFDRMSPAGMDATDYAHADWHAATIAHFGTDTYFYGGNDGGLVRARDNGTAGVLHGGPQALTWEDGLNVGITSHLVYSVAAGSERPPTAGCASGNADLILGGFQDNGTRLRVLSGGTNFVGFNQVAGGDGFGVGLGCAAGSSVYGSNLLSTYASQISTSDNGTAPQPTFTVRVSSNGTGLNPPIALDPGFTFIMRIASDLNDPAGRTYLTPLTDTTRQGHVYLSTDGGHTWNGINGTIHRTDGTTVTKFPLAMTNIATHPKQAGVYGAVMQSRAYVGKFNAASSSWDWFESPKMASSTASNYLPLQTMAFDPSDPSGNTIWVGSKAASLNDGAPIPAGSHLYKCTNLSTSPVCVSSGAGIPPSVPVNVVKVDPNDASTIYVGTEIGLYRSQNGGTSFTRYGNNLPLVSVTDIAVAYDSSSVRISTFGRGFWEINPKAGGSPAGVAGNGDFDANGVIDGFDLVREAGLLGLDSSWDAYNGIGNLVGSTNSIDASDFTTLMGKFGGRP